MSDTKIVELNMSNQIVLTQEEYNSAILAAKEQGWDECFGSDASVGVNPYRAVIKEENIIKVARVSSRGEVQANVEWLFPTASSTLHAFLSNDNVALCGSADRHITDVLSASLVMDNVIHCGDCFIIYNNLVQKKA